MREIISGNPDTRIVTWISSEWLADHLDDASLLIVDCRQNSHAYFQEHIPGAIHLHEELLRMHIGKLPVKWISPEAAQVLFSTLGFEQDRPVVVYSGTRSLTSSSAATSDGLEQTLVAYSLARFGCRKVMVLDGGLATWKSENRKLTQDFGTSRLSPFTVEVQIEFLIGYEECVRLKDEPDTILLDTRPLSVYEGQGPWIKPGHIPGAVNLPTSWMFAKDGSFKEKEVLDVLAAGVIGKDKNREIVTYCDTGTCCPTWYFMLKEVLGYKRIYLYDGSIEEWTADPNAPVHLNGNNK